MNGVIQVNSIDAPEHAGGHFRVRTGDFATRAYDAVAGGTSRMIAAVVGYETFETNGNEYRSFDASGRTNPNGSLAQFTTKDQRAHSYFFAKLEGRESLEGLSLQIHDQRWQYETGHGWFFQIPDVGESMREAREIGTLRYKRSVFEVVAQAQRHYLHHDMRFAPNGAYGGFYPAGVTEFLETHVDSGFSRVQANVKAPRGAVVLGGIEQSLFYYGGDDKHYANARLSDAAGGYPPTPNNAFEPLGPYYEYVLNRPVSTSSAFAQITSGEWLGDHAELTLGARYDNLWFNYDDVAAAGKPEKWKSYQQLSPRAGLVVKATDSLTFKALAGRAFRAPAPVELFGANTFALASNINALKPEYVTTYELAADAKVSRGLSWRTNVFYTELENQIAYGGQNLLTNIYSHTNAGVESEVLYEVEAGPIRVDGFANVSDVRLLHEKVQDPSISLENHRVTWAASDSAKAGIRAGRGAWVFATSALWQGPANRRASDRATPVNDAARPSKIDAWTRIDANVAWEPADWGRLAIKVTNLTDERARIIKNGDFPFDYRAAGRRVMATFEMNL